MVALIQPPEARECNCTLGRAIIIIAQWSLNPRISVAVCALMELVILFNWTLVALSDN